MAMILLQAPSIVPVNTANITRCHCLIATDEGRFMSRDSSRSAAFGSFGTHSEELESVKTCPAQKRSDANRLKGGQK